MPNGPTPALILPVRVFSALKCFAPAPSPVTPKIDKPCLKKLGTPRTARSAIGSSFLAAALGLIFATKAPAQVTVSDTTLLAMVERSDIPSYPDEDRVLNKTGVVVVRLNLAPDLHVESVSILQSPSDAMSQSVQKALQNWKFRDLGVSHKHAVSSTVVFYFVKYRGTHRVYLAKDAPSFEQLNYEQSSHK